MPTFATYIPFSEINKDKPSTTDEFHEAIKKFPRTKLLHVCGAVNALLRSDTEPINKAAHDRLVVELFDRPTAEYLLAYREEVRFVFHRQQTLFVAKTAVLQCADNAGAIERDQFPAIGRVFLMAGDHLPELSTQKPEPLDEKFAYFSAQLLPVQEGSGFHRFDHKMARSYQMIEHSALQLRNKGRAYWDIPALFEQKVGLPLLTFQALLFGALAKFRDFNPVAYADDPRSYALNRSWFKLTKVSPELINRFLDVVSSTPDDFKDAFERGNWGSSDFTPFRDRPLFRDGEWLFLLDFSFLAEKFEAGPFWSIHNSLPDNAQKGDLHSFWGEVFERYGCDILRTSCSEAANVFTDSPRFQDATKGEVCDGLVVCGTSAAFIEMKGSTFSSRAKYSNDYRQLMAELDSKLVQEPDGTPKAVYQLKRSIELAFDRNSPEHIVGVDLRLVDTVYPVIVTRDDIGSVLGVNGFLQLRFAAALAQNAVAARVTPLFCLNAEDFERLSGYLSDTPLTDLLHAHYRACKERGDYLLSSYFALSGNRLLQKLGVRRPETSVKSFKSFETAAVERLGLERGT